MKRSSITAKAAKIVESSLYSSSLRSLRSLRLGFLAGALAGRWLLPIVALLALIACGGTGVTQTNQTQHYKVQLTLDGTGFGERTATVEVTDLAGQPVAADQIVLAPVMRQMGMASPETTAQPVGPGRYQAKGEFFPMNGAWEVEVRVGVNGQEEATHFTFEVAQ